MATRLLRVFTGLAMGAFVLGGCGSEDNPYDPLSSDALRYVIPDSEDLTSGELCPDGGACSGPITVGTIKTYQWVRVDGVVVPAESGDSGSVPATLSAVEQAETHDRRVDDGLDVQLWGPDVTDIRTALSRDFEVWAGVDTEMDYAVLFIAFDAQGRFAGVGNAAADYFTIPVAELAASAGAVSGMDFVRPLMAG